MSISYTTDLDLTFDTNDSNIVSISASSLQTLLKIKDLVHEVVDVLFGMVENRRVNHFLEVGVSSSR